MRRLSRLLAIALVLPASAQMPDAVALYIGPMPNPSGLVTPLSKDLADSYADLRKAHIKARSTAIALEEPMFPTVSTASTLQLPGTAQLVAHSA